MLRVTVASLASLALLACGPGSEPETRPVEAPVAEAPAEGATLGPLAHEVESPPPSSVTIVSTPPGAEVFDDEGTLLGNTPFEVQADALPVRLTLRALDHRDRSVSVEAATAPTLEVALEVLPGRAPRSAPPPPPPPAPLPGVLSCPPTGACEVDARLIGMREADVLAELGSPSRRSADVWTYRRGGMGHPIVTLELHLAGGRVREAIAARTYDDLFCP